MNKDKILITGSCGTIGRGLVNQILKDKKYKGEVICFDNNESQLFFQEQEFINDKRVKVVFGDIRDNQRIKDVSQGVDLIYHTAALKHVAICEKSPMEPVQSNILGVNNLIQASIKNKIKKVIFTSSDKAVNPTNVMGTSKLMGERLITAANSNKRSGSTIFASTRFGNVLGSNGSVIPIFRKQIEKGGPVTLTNIEMTRFIMSIEDAVKLVVKSAEIAKGGEVFVTKMPVIRILDLAQVMIKELAPKFGYKPSSIKITQIGSKPGEKMYEELMSHEETRRSLELKDFFAVLPAFRGFYKKINYNYKEKKYKKINKPYISDMEPKMSHKELGKFLKNNNLLSYPKKNKEPDKRYWPGDKP